MVAQNEYGTVGGRSSQQTYIYSTGFFACLGVVVHCEEQQIAALAHVAPKTVAVTALDSLFNDFRHACPGANPQSTKVLIFGGQAGREHKEKREAIETVVGMSGHAETVDHVPLSDLGVRPGTVWGFWFNRTTGTYEAIAGAPAVSPPSRSDFLAGCSLVDQTRQTRNTSNDNRGENASMYPAQNVRERLTSGLKMVHKRKRESGSAGEASTSAAALSAAARKGKQARFQT